MNRVVLIGRLTKDPDLQFLPGSGTAVTKFTLAVDRRFKKEGQQEADFIPIVVWNKIAESSANYLTKGKLAGIAGRIQTRNYEAKDGHRVYITEVVADEVQFLEWGDKKQEQQPQKAQQNNNEDYTEVIGEEDDIPF
ncbi:single-stranded DNA-binding protein [Clostridium tyrobutyricum]|uniref:single-stranded DNA-binding protein n=1 Tax=Clostridium tyrobutyricum TaxID=1519 RepID=UPI0030CF1818